jgi:hypothetical protein
MGDRISRPSYYCEDRLIEPIEVIEDWSLNYHLGSAIKYISRAGRKLYGFSQFEDDAILSEIEDLKKAIWYMQRRIKRLHVQLQEVIQFEVEEDEPCQQSEK